MRNFIAAMICCCVSAGMAYAGTIVGQASVVDGDTIAIHRTRIRLAAIDAPEASQPCHRRDGTTWRCGQKAALALAHFIGDTPVTCAPSGHDRYDRILASCTVAGIDIAAWMIENGGAIAYFDRGHRYTEASARAGAARRNIWSGTFQKPKDWRQSNQR